jgi:hypothetical protein
MYFKFTSWNAAYLNPKAVIQNALLLIILYASPAQLNIRRKFGVEADLHYKYSKLYTVSRK